MYYVMIVLHYSSLESHCVPCNCGLPVLDSPDANVEQHFDECFTFIDEAKRMGGGVLVHCFAGKSRR